MATPSMDLTKRARAQGFSARFILLTGKTLKDGRHPIMLQLIQRRVKRYSTGEACTAGQWDKDAGRMKPRAKGGARTNATLAKLEARVADIVEKLAVHDRLTLDAFHALYTNPKATEDVLGAMEDHAASLEQDGNPGYASTFTNAANALRRFTGGKDLRFADLTPSKLESFAKFLSREGCAAGGVAAYMRTVRVVVNKAIKEGTMAREAYPFKTARNEGFDMAKWKSTHKPRALDAEDMDKLKAFPFDKYPHLAQSVRLFLFGYYARGMNFADMAKLKPSDLRKGRITYTRSKTRRAGEGAVISLPLSAPLAEILEHFADHEGPYLFPILGREHVTPKQQWNRTRKCLKELNADMKEAAEVVGIEEVLTSYVLRHTYATTQKESGVDVGLISELMGHSSVDVTKAYLRKFPAETLDATDSNL